MVSLILRKSISDLKNAITPHDLDNNSHVQIFMELIIFIYGNNARKRARLCAIRSRHEARISEKMRQSIDYVFLNSGPTLIQYYMSFFQYYEVV